MSNNILEPVVNSLSETFKVGLKWFYKLMNINSALYLYVILIPIVIMGVGLLAVYLHNNI